MDDAEKAQTAIARPKYLCDQCGKARAHGNHSMCSKKRQRMNTSQEKR